MAAGLVAQPGEYPWSSAHAHLTGEDDHLVKVSPLFAMVGNWREFLCLSEEQINQQINQGQTTFFHEYFLCFSHYRLFACTAFLLFLELPGDQAPRLFLL